MRLSLILIFSLLPHIVIANNITIEQQLDHCRALTDKTIRLNCYDAIKPNKTTTTVSSATDTVEPSTQNPELNSPQNQDIAATEREIATTSAAEQEFGNLAEEDPDKLRQIELTVSKVKKSAYGNLILSFTNGQMWKQIDSRRFKVKAGEQIFIKTGALNSFMLGKDGQNSTIRVKRIK